MGELLNPAAGMPPALLLRRLIGSYRITHAIKAAAQLAISDYLGERPQSAGELAARLHANPLALYRLLQNCHRAMAPGGRVLIVQLLMPGQGGGAAPEPLFEAAVSDLNMLVLTGGRERTEGEYRTLLGRAGFRLARVVPSRALVSLIEGEGIAP